MLFRETIGCFTFMLLFVETPSTDSQMQGISESTSVYNNVTLLRQSTASQTQGISESTSIYNNVTLLRQSTDSQTQGISESTSIYNNVSSKKDSESSSTAKTDLQNSEPTPSFENYTTAVVPNNNKENCSHEHTFPVTLKYWTKKTSTNCFRYTLLNENFCRERYPETFVIAIVHSHPKNFKRRSLIRKMWANNEFYKKFKLATVFAMGEDPQNPSVQVTLQRELETYEDIIQFSFLDTYKNLTLKAISWLNWASKYCPNASYILKVDDDMFVNIFGIMRLLQKENARNPSVKTFYCTVWTKMKPERNKESKWYVSYDEFSQRVYPKYCSGSSYSLTMRAVRPLLDSVKHTTFLWVDDAYITGLLASVAKVQLTDIRSIYKFSDDKMKNFFDNPSIFVHLPNTMNKRYALWKKTLEFCNMADCSK